MFKGLYGKSLNFQAFAGKILNVQDLAGNILPEKQHYTQKKSLQHPRDLRDRDSFRDSFREFSESFRLMRSRQFPRQFPRVFREFPTYEIETVSEIVSESFPRVSDLRDRDSFRDSFREFSESFRLTRSRQFPRQFPTVSDRDSFRLLKL